MNGRHTELQQTGLFVDYLRHDWRDWRVGRLGSGSAPGLLEPCCAANGAEGACRESWSTYRAPHVFSSRVIGEDAINQQALDLFQDAKIRESALVYLDDDVIRPAIHDNVWAVSLEMPEGSGILPNPQTGQWTKVTYFLAVFDAHTGSFLFAESQ